MNKIKKASIIYFIIIILILSVSIILALAGNLKQSITYNELEKLSIELAYDFDEKIKTDKNVASAKIAIDKDLHIIYMNFISENEAKIFYEEKKVNMEKFDDIEKTTNISLGSHYSKWFTYGKNHLQIITRVRNTVLYSVCDMESKEKVNAFFDKIRY